MTGSDETRRLPRWGRGLRVPSPGAGLISAGILLLGGAALFLAWTSAGSESGTGDTTGADLARAEELLVSALASDDTDTFSEADRLYGDVLATDPDQVAALRGAAVVDLGLHRFSSALDRAEAALALQPNDHVALAALVDANIELGHYDDAESHLERLLALRPGVEAYSRLSYLRQLRGEDDAAVEAMFLARLSVSQGSTEQARIDDLLGELYAELGETDAALAHQRLAVEAAPGRYEMGLARILAHSGDRAGAQAMVDELLAADEGDTGALMLLVELQVGLSSAASPGSEPGDPGGVADPAGPEAIRVEATTVEAIEVVVEAAAGELAAGYGVDPSQALFEATYADPEQALELAQVIHHDRPDNIKADHALAWALHRAGRSEEAVAHLEDALRFDTSDAVLHRHAAEIYEAVGRPELAEEHRSRAAGLGPGSTPE